MVINSFLFVIPHQNSHINLYSINCARSGLVELVLVVIFWLLFFGCCFLICLLLLLLLLPLVIIANDNNTMIGFGPPPQQQQLNSCIVCFFLFLTQSQKQKEFFCVFSFLDPLPNISAVQENGSYSFLSFGLVRSGVISLKTWTNAARPCGCANNCLSAAI